MRLTKGPGKASPDGFLTRLARDKRGNALVLGAAAMIPLAGMVGGGVDLSRMYLVKTRLQHACDAGALAGRKAMGGGSWDHNNRAAEIQAKRFFEANIAPDAFGSSNITKAFSESAGRVSGTASAQLPMTIMRIFGQETKTLSVSCEAEMLLSNTDVMFVLDTTGSMDDTLPKDTKTKIEGLRTAVLCFYEILAQRDTVETCNGGKPSGGTSSDIQVRFGFMPYSTNVNVGKLLPTSYIANRWNYQTRVYAGSNEPNFSDWHFYELTWQETNHPSGSKCPDYVKGNYEVKGDPRSEVIRGHRVNFCYYEVRWKNGPKWNYDRHSVDVSGLKNGVAWRGNITLPIGHFRQSKQIDWKGCIEERDTRRLSSYYPIPAGAKDLNIDLVPTADTTTQWGPSLPGLIYLRRRLDGNHSFNRAQFTSPNDYDGLSASCPDQAHKLAVWNDATAFEDYVEGLTPVGNTYHDIGLLWGARFLSPTGMFASENAKTKTGGRIERHIIFMTDGDTQAFNTDYAAYGVAWFDRRQTADNVVPTDTDLDTQIDRRFEALCTEIKNRPERTTLWVISFGNLQTATLNRLQTCASENRYFSASNSTELQRTFRSIAEQIVQLKLIR